MHIIDLLSAAVNCLQKAFPWGARPGHSADVTSRLAHTMRSTTTVCLSALFLLFLPVDCPDAELATVEEMESVCLGWASYIAREAGSWAGEETPRTSGSREVFEGEKLLARCFSMSPRGFVVVPVLKELPPVTAYSDQYDMDPSLEKGFPQLLREVLRHRISLYETVYGSLDAAQPSEGEVLFNRAHRQAWDGLSTGKRTFQPQTGETQSLALAQGGPLLTTSWHQGPPYNDSCPPGDGGRCVVGCVATAAAQIMRYWRWPTHGTGSYSYDWNGDQSCGGNTGGGILSAVFSDGYDWQSMPDSCDQGCTPGDSAALAELCREVGIAFRMDYGACGSGAYTARALTVYPAFFRYSPLIDRESRQYHTADAWFSIIRNEINAGRPIQYRINRHSIVCDGWRHGVGLNQYHMNYGWAGPFNAWFTVDDLYCPWAGCDPLVEYLIRYIMPEPPVFIRGDVSADEVISMADATLILRHLYGEADESHACLSAGDVDDDGTVTLTDAISTLRYLYVPGSQQPSPPFPNCGLDDTPDEIDCATHPCGDVEQNVSPERIDTERKRIDSGVSFP